MILKRSVVVIWALNERLNLLRIDSEVSGDVLQATVRRPEQRLRTAREDHCPPTMSYSTLRYTLIEHDC
jgi:hypothetical protein